MIKLTDFPVHQLLLFHAFNVKVRKFANEIKCITEEINESDKRCSSSTKRSSNFQGIQFTESERYCAATNASTRV